MYRYIYIYIKILYVSLLKGCLSMGPGHIDWAPLRRSSQGISRRRSPPWPPCLVARNAAPTYVETSGDHNLHRRSNKYTRSSKKKR